MKAVHAKDEATTKAIIDKALEWFWASQTDGTTQAGEDMIERAAKAMCVSQLYAGAWDRLHEGAQETYRTNARAALLAALDPEDEALVRYVLTDCEDKPWDEFAAIVRMVIASLSKLAQGGTD